MHRRGGGCLSKEVSCQQQIATMGSTTPPTVIMMSVELQTQGEHPAPHLSLSPAASALRGALFEQPAQQRQQPPASKPIGAKYVNSPVVAQFEMKDTETNHDTYRYPRCLFCTTVVRDVQGEKPHLRPQSEGRWDQIEATHKGKYGHMALAVAQIDRVAAEQKHTASRVAAQATTRTSSMAT